MIIEFFGTVLAVEYSVANRKRFVDSNQPFFFALYAVGHPTSPVYPEDFLRSVRAVALLRIYRWSEISVEKIRELKDRIARSTFSRSSRLCSFSRKFYLSRPDPSALCFQESGDPIFRPFFPFALSDWTSSRETSKNKLPRRRRWVLFLI